MGGSKHTVELRTGFPGPAYAKIDVFGSDFATVAAGILAKLRELHLGILIVEGAQNTIQVPTLRILPC
jgi:hypothetical protein